MCHWASKRATYSPGDVILEHHDAICPAHAVSVANGGKCRRADTVVAVLAALLHALLQRWCETIHPQVAHSVQPLQAVVLEAKTAGHCSAVQQIITQGSAYLICPAHAVFEFCASHRHGFEKCLLQHKPRPL